jgi:transcriptional regulator with XRE-family HTH domain
MNQHTEKTREQLLALLSERFGTDAAFEEAAGLTHKTVSNWRLGRSSSFMKMLPELSAVLGVRPTVLLPSGEGEDEDEARLLWLWRAAAALPTSERRALLKTLESVVRLYLGRQDEL